MWQSEDFFNHSFAVFYNFFLSHSLCFLLSCLFFFFFFGLSAAHTVLVQEFRFHLGRTNTVSGNSDGKKADKKCTGDSAPWGLRLVAFIRLSKILTLILSSTTHFTLVVDKDTVFDCTLSCDHTFILFVQKFNVPRNQSCIALFIWFQKIVRSRTSSDANGSQNYGLSTAYAILKFFSLSKVRVTYCFREDQWRISC